MPKVSDEHLAARREQIIRAALESFGANGFHATTMADVIGTSGLSAGAVYRYFRSKDELIAAIAARAVGEGARAVDELLAHDEAPDLVDLLRHVMLALQSFATAGPVDLRRLALQAWAEALRNDAVMKTVREAQLRLRHYFEDVARRAQEHGRLPPDADPALVAQALLALLLGWVVQHLIIQDAEIDTYLRGVESLLHPPLPPS